VTELNSLQIAGHSGPDIDRFHRFGLTGEVFVIGHFAVDGHTDLHLRNTGRWSTGATRLQPTTLSDSSMATPQAVIDLTQR